MLKKDNGNNKDLFYCYSYRLHLFLLAFNIDFIEKGKNLKTDKTYYVYKRNDKLNLILQEWDNIKKRIDLDKVI